MCGGMSVVFLHVGLMEVGMPRRRMQVVFRAEESFGSKTLKLRERYSSKD